MDMQRQLAVSANIHNKERYRDTMQAELCKENWEIVIKFVITEVCESNC